MKPNSVNSRRKTRQSSNVFNMLTKDQIMKLHEGFNLLDCDGAGKLSVKGLTVFLDTIGSPFTDEEIAEMINELNPNPNYMMLLTYISEKLSKIRSEDQLCESFKLFCERDDKLIDNDFFKFWMTKKGESISEEDYDYLVKGCVENNMINYKKLMCKIKYGEIIESKTE